MKSRQEKIQGRNDSLQPTAPEIRRFAITQTFCPGGTTDPARRDPTFQRWGPAPNGTLVPKGRLKEWWVSKGPPGITDQYGLVTNVETVAFYPKSLPDGDEILEACGFQPARLGH